MSSVVDWSLLIIELYKRFAERYARKVVALPYTHKFDLEAAPDIFKNVTACSKLVPEGFSRMFKIQRFLKKKVTIEEGRNGGESGLYY